MANLHRFFLTPTYHHFQQLNTIAILRPGGQPNCNEPTPSHHSDRHTIPNNHPSPHHPTETCKYTKGYTFTCDHKQKPKYLQACNAYDTAMMHALHRREPRSPRCAPPRSVWFQFKCRLCTPYADTGANARPALREGPIQGKVNRPERMGWMRRDG
ncbi:hypothetical protein B0A55_02682 [Friedmanniomyces simplex]|uniref:Uncharacterized protein n=1 Tax=Friedmanniomyces simplex TaxID=329884 RepID=A0A4U0XVI1_9PEZI|nr:hypothetical protein B0A55_02682 [Friedmanniomyces simplex]